MSFISHLLGLDRHPSILAAINEAGKQALPEVSSGTAVEDAIHAEVAKAAQEVVRLLPMPDEDKALAAFWISGMVNAKIAGVLAQYEAVPPTPVKDPEAPAATPLSRVLNVAGTDEEVGTFPPTGAGGQG